eukprot:6213349-Pleurochrysis_carterae.AAC.1
MAARVQGGDRPDAVGRRPARGEGCAARLGRLLRRRRSSKAYGKGAGQCVMCDAREGGGSKAKHWTARQTLIRRMIVIR